MNLDHIKATLTTDEGKRDRLYKDNLGNLTIGVGHNLAKPIGEKTIQAMLEDDIDDAVSDLDDQFSWWRELDDDRQDVMVNMCFNMGLNRLSGFHHFLAALQAKDFPTAADEMLKSLWANQVGDRAKRLAAVIRGDDHGLA